MASKSFLIRAHSLGDRSADNLPGVRQKLIRRGSALAAAAMLLGASALAQIAPPRPALDNFDLRARTARPASNQSAAVEVLQGRLASASVSFDPITASPKSIASTASFLTGPRGEGGANLASITSGLGKNDDLRAVRGFLDSYPQLFGHGSEALASAKVNRDYTTAHNGLRTIVWQQQVGGIPVFEGLLVAHVARGGELVTLNSSFSTGTPTGLPKGVAVANYVNSPTVNAQAAIAASAVNLGEATLAGQLATAAHRPHLPEWSHFTGEGILGEASVRQVWVPMGPGSLRLGWEVLFTSAAWNQTFRVVVDADKGQPILRHCLTADASPASYRVYTSDSPSPFSPGHQTPMTGQPPLTNRELVTITSINPTASPNGWINDGDNETLGNNVEAHTDLDRNNQPDLPRPQGNPNRVFDPPLDLTQSPTNFSDAAVVNLFYWNNVVHDRLYELGFTEAAGNFQTDNFGRGGAGGDAVQADAQDGAGFNNANFSTPPDGFPGRMQMFLWDFTNPNRDGDYDSDVVIHEYVHGLSNRRVGNGVGISALQTAGMGEGWSDFYALSLLNPTDNPNSAYPMGGYVTFVPGQFEQNYYFGIRRYPKSTDLNKNPLTFKDIDPAQASAHPGVPRNPFFGPQSATSVHNQGEVWCAALWDARANLMAKYGATAGNQLTMQLVTDGMGLTPANPNFLEARDGVLMADLVNNGGANRREIGLAFAKRGMGVGATSPQSFTTAGVKESFQVAGLELVAQLAQDFPVGNANGSIDPGETPYQWFTIKNTGFIDLTNIVGTLTTTTPGITVVTPIANFGAIAQGATGTNTAPFKFAVDPAVACGTTVQFRLVTATTAGSFTNTFSELVGNKMVVASFTNTFEAAGLPAPIPDLSTNDFPIDITLSNVTEVADINVSVRLDHTFMGDLTLSLVSPTGIAIPLSINNGGFFQGYGTGDCSTGVRTTFDDSAAQSISAGTPPYAGVFRPNGNLTNLNGQLLNGTWKLRIEDSFGFDSGDLLCWGMEVVSVETTTTCEPFSGEADVIVASTALITESFSPPDGAVSSGETVTMSVALRNQGGVPVDALSATVLPSAQVVPTGGAVSYGTLDAGGGEATRDLSFKVTAPPGSAAIVQLRLFDGVDDMGVISFAVQVSGSTVWSNPAQITINPINAATPYPSSITIAGAPGLISKVRVRLNKYQHAFPADVDVLLVGPSGQKVMLMSDAGGNSAINAGINLTFDSQAAAMLPLNGPLLGGTYQPTDHQPGESLPGAAPAGPYGTSLAVFNNQGLNGTWRLFVADDSEGDGGAIVAGWELEISSFVPLNPAGDLAVTATASSATPLAGLPFTYTIRARNQGAAAAGSVVVTNQLPAGLTLNTPSVSQGSVTNTGSTVIASFGAIAQNATATLTLNVTPAAAGAVTNVATVTAPMADINLSNNVSSLVVNVMPPAPMIEAGTSTLLTESLAPPNGGVDAGETVTMDFALRNVGSADAVNVVATLSASGGVSAPGGPQNYGTLVKAGAAVARSFQFTAAPTSSVITATLQLSINGGSAGSVQFPITIGASTGVTNSVPIIIPTVGTAAPYPSTIQIVGLTGAVQSVTATLNGLTHGFASDVDVLLVSPDGKKVMLMSDAGGNSAPNAIALTFADAAASGLPANGPIVSGTFKPTDHQTGDVLPAPAPGLPYGSAMSAFNGINPNGTWSLFVYDSINGDAGQIAGGWTLAIQTIASVNPSTDLRVTGVGAPTTAVTGSNVTYTLTVTNLGPATATSVMLTNRAPQTATILSATSSVGSVTTNSGSVVASLGALAAGAKATVTVQVRPFAFVNMTNVASVASALVDTVPVDNTTTLTTTVLAPPSPALAVSAMVGNQFALKIAGNDGVAYVIDASSDLVTWLPISTNLLNGSMLVFSDPGSTNQPTRFYRARVLGQ